MVGIIKVKNSLVSKAILVNKDLLELKIPLVLDTLVSKVLMVLKILILALKAHLVPKVLIFTIIFTIFIKVPILVT